MNLSHDPSRNRTPMRYSAPSSRTIATEAEAPIRFAPDFKHRADVGQFANATRGFHAASSPGNSTEEGHIRRSRAA